MINATIARIITERTIPTLCSLRARLIELLGGVTEDDSRMRDLESYACGFQAGLAARRVFHHNGKPSLYEAAQLPKAPR